MNTLLNICLVISLLSILSIGPALARTSVPGTCYCDSSTGRNVLNNGDYSSSYCTRRAVMNMQKFEGCCMWKGGVAKITQKGGVQCNDGSTSELCTRQLPNETAAVY